MNVIESLIGAYKEGVFTLSSGETSNEFLDLKIPMLRPISLMVLCNNIAYTIYKWNIKYRGVAGVAIGGVPLACLTSQLVGCPYMIVRQEKKSHGTVKLIEGTENVEKGSGVVLLEDVITTGSSTIKAANILKDEGYAVAGVIAVVDREVGGIKKVRNALSCNCECLTTLSSIKHFYKYEEFD